MHLPTPAFFGIPVVLTTTATSGPIFGFPSKPPASAETRRRRTVSRQRRSWRSCDSSRSDFSSRARTCRSARKGQPGGPLSAKGKTRFWGGGSSFFWEVLFLGEGFYRQGVKDGIRGKIPLWFRRHHPKQAKKGKTVAP